MSETVGRESRIVLVPLSIHQHKKTTIVEDVQAKEFYEMSPASVDAIHAIQAGTTLGEIEDSLRNKYPNEEVDILVFVKDLIELGMVVEVDGRVIGSRQYISAAGEELPRNGFAKQLGRLLFRSPLMLIYGVAIIYCVWTLTTKPQYRPELHSMHLLESMTINVIIWAGLSLLLLAFHEFSHFLAARAFDVPAKYGLGHRLFFLVLETDISAVWKLPPRQRLIPYFAGMLNDFFMLAVSIGARILYPGMNDLLYQIFEISTLYLCSMLIFQTFVFMKTDLYYVLETSTGTLNLKERADDWLKSVFTRHKAKEKASAFVKVYSGIYIAGLAFIVWLFPNVALPQFLHFLEHARDYLSYPITDYYFWDGVLFIILNSALLVLLFYSWARKWVQQYRSRTKQSVTG